MDKIYFKGWKACKTVAEVLIAGFVENEYDRDIFLFKQTYFDEAFKSLQCYQARRSFEELYAICATCIEGLTIKQFAKEIKNFFNSNRNFCILYCCDIMKPVHYKCDLRYFENGGDYIAEIKDLVNEFDEDSEPEDYAIAQEQVETILSYYK